EWVHVQLHQQKGMISLSPPTICNSAPNLIQRIWNGRNQSGRWPSPLSDYRRFYESLFYSKLGFFSVKNISEYF
ncbi:hypothetical protein O9499_18325, partial [Proteus mirabilis]|uniref:hypothetical protein n=1 Tax=Proteus mirabilis TaxID=584 RepID=UPI002576EF04